MNYTQEQTERAIARGVKPDIQKYVDTRRNLMAGVTSYEMLTDEVRAKVAFLDDQICNNS